MEELKSIISKSTTLVFLGRSGCGKDTQMEFLMKRAELADAVKIVMGDSFRELAAKNLLLGRKVREVIEAGGLLPLWLEIYVWASEIAGRVRGEEILVFDGTRRLAEAKTLDEALKFLGRPLAVAILIEVSPEESLKRLLGRGRVDDTEERVRNRLRWFESEVLPTIAYYRQAGRLIEVNGEQSREEVFKELENKLEEYFAK